jgi:elongation factor P hydroxylase
MHVISSTQQNIIETARWDRDLQKIFHACFFQQFNTVLQGEADEPLYEPVGPTQAMNIIHYRNDYFSSALHEIAHWCIAGPKRREQCDYGYWYSPDGRSFEEQQAFQKVEIKPQAIEWAFSIACAIQFRVSIDNLQAQETSDQMGLMKQEQEFTRNVKQQLLDFVKDGFPTRAQMFLTSLNTYYSSEALIANDKRITSMGLPL